MQARPTCGSEVSPQDDTLDTLNARAGVAATVVLSRILKIRPTPIGLQHCQ